MYFLTSTKLFLTLIISFSNIARANLDFFSRLKFSHKEYEKYIIVQSAIMTEAEVMQFFDSIPLPDEPRKNRDLYRKKLFLIVQCKNIGELRASGEVLFNIQGINFSIPIYCPSLPSHMERFCNCAVIYLGEGIILDADEEHLEINYHWRKLNTL